ncbi:aminoglycoside phosphotransferase family protein [Brevibacillus nitrificans]|uniref:phosphotransferase family protein n=1 Tax=Brevibacillus nitrificans TaxID=651560 RepID=UPI00285F6598|nr:aminoglycoside phosphotransferase family protein [Brevibacillus nitrificans]MDR7318829.1 aminoglycoside phosphotransferase (APT) family kinase protein [Brevibacillus nitrificans]
MTCNRTNETDMPERVLRWIVASVEAASEVLHVQQLQGGISSLIHRITLRRSGVEQSYVVRQFNNEDWLREEPDLALHEAESLRHAERLAIPTPKLIAYDETGAHGNVPAVLMSHLIGSVVLEPHDKQGWINGLASTLVTVHDSDTDEFPWKYATYQNLETLEAPAWGKDRTMWQQVIDYVKQPRPAFPPRFIHRDYHPTNVLWANGDVSGVVDWVNACVGPAGIDVGHCRVNLAQLYDVETADAFLSAYQQEARETFMYDPYWDLVSLTDILFGPPQVYAGWTALGFTGLTDALIADRLEEYAKSLVERIAR